MFDPKKGENALPMSQIFSSEAVHAVLCVDALTVRFICFKMRLNALTVRYIRIEILQI